jgi:general secretion pathway protein A
VAEPSRRTLDFPYHGLRTKPFRDNTDPAFLWLGPPYRDALNTLRAGVLRNAGVLLLTGEVGVGKTMLARALADRLAAEGVRVATLGHVALPPDEFRNGVARALGAPAAAETRDALREFLRAAHARGEKVLLVVDEAQNLDAPLLDEIGELVRLGREAGHGAVDVLNVLLVSQPGIETLLRRKKRRDRADLVAVRAHLGPLDAAQVGEYVVSRLRAAGGDRELFSMDAIAEVAAMSGGVPRLINQICDRTLLVTSPWNGCMVSAGVVRGAFREIDPGIAGAGRRWMARARSRPALLAASVVLAAGLGVVVYHYEGDRLPGRVRDLVRSATGSAAAPVAAVPPPSLTPGAASAPAATTSGDSAPATEATAPGVPATTGVTPPADGTAAAPAPERAPAMPPAVPGATVPSVPAERPAGAPRIVDATEGPAAPRATTPPSTPRDTVGQVGQAQEVKPRVAPATPARIQAPPPVVSPPSRPSPPPRERAPEPAPARRAPSSDAADDPSAIIDWLLQRNPAAGR